VYGNVLLTGLLLYNYWIHAEHEGLHCQLERGPQQLRDPAGPTSQQDFFFCPSNLGPMLQPTQYYLVGPGSCFHRGKSAEV